MISFIRTENGSISVLSAAILAALIGAAALAAEVGNWYVTNVEMQRAADLGAIGGAYNYASLSTGQSAINAAVAAAQLNGATTATAQMVNGVRSASDQAVQVTATTTLPLLLTAVLMSGNTVAISATATAEVIPPTSGGPACVLALSQVGTALSIGGNSSLSLSGCTLRSNSSMNVFGAAGATTLAAFAAGSISGSSAITTTPTAGQIFANDGVIPDPYASYSALQNALAAAGGGGPSLSVSPNQSVNLAPGNYSGWDIKGTVNLAPGTYYVNGTLTINSQANITGNGVTIIGTGSITINGGATLNLSAPPAGAGAGVPGIVFADSSNTTIKINGGSSTGYTGALYFPNASAEFTGNSSNGGNGCTQLVANSVSFKGSGTLGSNCTGAGTITINSGSVGVALVQ